MSWESIFYILKFWIYRSSSWINLLFDSTSLFSFKISFWKSIIYSFYYSLSF